MRLVRLLKQDLANEVDEWLSEGIIDEAQQAKILERYGIVPGAESALSYQILMGLGILFVGLALITLIGANWEEIPRYLRTLGLVALTAATHLIGWQYVRGGELKNGFGLLFLGNFFFGASIILIAQIFHLGEHMPDGVFYWALGCLAMVLATRSRLIAVQMMALSVIWLVIEASLGFFPLLFPIFLMASAYVLRQSPSILLVVTSIASCALWFEYAAAFYWSEGRRLDFEAEHIVLTASLVAFIYGMSQWLLSSSRSIYQDYGTAIAVWCLRFCIIFVLIFSFAEPWREMLTANWNNWISLVVMCLVLWAAALYCGLRAGNYFSLLAFFCLLLITTFALLLVEQDVHAAAFQFLYNLVAVGLGVWLVMRGIRARASHYFWSGIFTILLIALFRYFDLIGSYIGGAILFLFIAAILLGAARYWRGVAAE